MTGLNRRKMLIASGGVTLGALGALGMASPARAQSTWTWQPTGSVAGAGEGVDPRWVWDPEADPVAAAILDRGQVRQVNEALWNWTRNDQPTPAELPSDVRDFIEYARQLPSWADQGKLATAAEFNKSRGLYLNLLNGVGGGMLSTAIPKEARAVYYSKGGADMRDRITKTAKLGYDIGHPRAYQPDGQMVVTALKTRLVHAAVRHLLPQSPYWPETGGQRPIPISQADIMVTWHSLATFAMRQLNAWGLRIRSAESDAFLHLWQVSAHMLGVQDEYIPASWDQAYAQSEQVLNPILAATPEGIALADILLDIAQLDLSGNGSSALRPVLHSMTRYMLGDEVTDALRIPREWYWDGLIDWAWPRFVALREGALLPLLPSQVFWAFDEILRGGVLLYLGEGENIFIEMPTANRSF
jgi:hypothetical protein